MGALKIVPTKEDFRFSKVDYLTKACSNWLRITCKDSLPFGFPYKKENNHQQIMKFVRMRAPLHTIIPWISPLASTFFPVNKKGLPYK